MLTFKITFLLCKCCEILHSHTRTSSKRIPSQSILPWFFTQGDSWWLRIDSFHSRPALNYINIIAMQVFIQGSGLKIWLPVHYITLLSLRRSHYKLMKSLEHSGFKDGTQYTIILFRLVSLGNEVVNRYNKSIIILSTRNWKTQILQRHFLLLLFL